MISDEERIRAGNRARAKRHYDKHQATIAARRKADRVANPSKHRTWDAAQRRRRNTARHAAANLLSYYKNREQIRLKCKARYDKFKIARRPKERRRGREHYARNIEQLRMKSRQRYADNVNNIRERLREWSRKHPWAQAGTQMRRHAAKLHATPEWANRKAIRSIYKAAALLTRTSGIPHNVDHIVPLMSRVVCGLHVEWNLQIITADQNRRKTNHFSTTTHS